MQNVGFVPDHLISPRKAAGILRRHAHATVPQNALPADAAPHNRFTGRQRHYGCISATKPGLGDPFCINSTEQPSAV